MTRVFVEDEEVEQIGAFCNVSAPAAKPPLTRLLTQTIRFITRATIVLLVRVTFTPEGFWLSLLRMSVWFYTCLCVINTDLAAVIGPRRLSLQQEFKTTSGNR